MRETERGTKRQTKLGDQETEIHMRETERDQETEIRREGGLEAERLTVKEGDSMREH